MSYDITRWEAGGLDRDHRRTSRVISRVASGGQIRQAQVEVEADVTAAKIDAITGATGLGLGAVAKVAQAEQALMQNFPTASGRLAFIAERHMLAVGDVLDELHYQVRRK